MKKDHKASEALSAFDQSKTFALNGISVTVEPLGVRHLRKFSAAVTKAAPDLIKALDVTKAATDGKEDQITDDGLGSFMKAVIPFFFTDLIELVDDCCSVALDKVPINLVPKIIDEWINVSFGEKEEGFKRLRPWLDLAQELMSRVGSRPSTKPLTSLSPLDTPGPTLSTGGQFQNSGSTSPQPISV